MTRFAVKGWCPDAWRPMPSGDGLLVRVKPRLGRLTRQQVLGLCEAALHHGNGLIDATSRANLQIRGVTEAGWHDLLERLMALDLVDRDPVTEARRNILLAPDWHPADDTARIAGDLTARLGDLPELPSKIGFAVDAGPAPMLTEASADFRIERGHGGVPILRAEGRPAGMAVTVDTAVGALIRLARWFVDSGGMAAGRMARHDAPLPDWAAGDVEPMRTRPRLVPGKTALGPCLGLAFGRIEASDLASLMDANAAQALRITPWRLAVFEGAVPVAATGFIADPDAPELRVKVCPGWPACPQATVATRSLASRLAPRVSSVLHVSGCAKGCAHPGPSDVTLTGRDGRFDLALAARAGTPPARAGLTSAEVLAHFGAA